MTVRSGPVGFLELVRCSLVIALTNLTPALTELLARWRRTLIYGASIAAYTVALVAVQGVPIYIALPVAWGTFAIAVTAALVWLGLAHRRHITVWRAWRGIDGAVCMIEWNPKRQRYEAHSWAAFRRHRHLGGPVADAAISHAPRPLWIEPALPELREMYRLSYGFADDPTSRWMYLPDNAAA